MKQTMPDAFLFDIGNVLITFDYSRVPPRIAERGPGTENPR